MKFAIKGHPTRGKEVIQILKNLGGRNISNHKGNDNYAYYISSIDNRIYKTSLLFSEYKHYTLEEFEREFPFKIGDEVIFPIKIGWASGKVTGLTYVEDKLKYEVNCIIGGYRYIEPHKLSLYPMKEERNITLTLDKAQEWYKKGGELREIALQAFSKKELSPLPRSWEEFSYKYKICSIRYAMPSKYEALYQLEQLKNCWWNGWKPDWNDDQQAKYCVICYHEGFKINILYSTSRFLSFPTHEMAKEFLECFKDLIEKAEDLI